jgi:hypothetical protein
MKISKVLRWLLFNGLFAVILWFGIIGEIDGARRLGLFLVWTTFILSLFLCSEEVMSSVVSQGSSVPAWMDNSFDFAVLSFLIWHGFIWSGIAYAIHFIFSIAVHEKIIELKKKSNP